MGEAKKKPEITTVTSPETLMEHVHKFAKANDLSYLEALQTLRYWADLLEEEKQRHFREEQEKRYLKAQQNPNQILTPPKMGIVRRNGS